MGVKNDGLGGGGVILPTESVSLSASDISPNTPTVPPVVPVMVSSARKCEEKIFNPLSCLKIWMDNFHGSLLSFYQNHAKKTTHPDHIIICNQIAL